MCVARRFEDVDVCIVVGGVEIRGEDMSLRIEVARCRRPGIGSVVLEERSATRNKGMQRFIGVLHEIRLLARVVHLSNPFNPLGKSTQLMTVMITAVGSSVMALVGFVVYWNPICIPIEVFRARS